jgi:hypothetical protein
MSHEHQGDDFERLFGGRRRPENARPDERIADGARTDLAEVAADARRAAAHMRERGSHAMRSARERAATMGPAVRGQARAALGATRSIAWGKVGAVGLAVVAIVIGGVALQKYGFLKNDGASVANATVEQNSEPSVRAVSAAPSAAVPQTKADPPIATDSVPSTPVANAVPAVAAPTPVLAPVPGEANAGTCALALPTLNDLYALKRPRTTEEQAWLRFGYDCLGRAQLAAGVGGFELPERVKERGGEKTSANTTAAAGVAAPMKTRAHAPEKTMKPVGVAATVPAVVPTAPVVPVPPSTCTLRGTARTGDGRVIAGAPIEITGIGAPFVSAATTDASGLFAIDGIPVGARVRVVLRARGYLDDVRETIGCSVPVALVGKKSNPLGSLFDAARRADRSIQGATH